MVPRVQAFAASPLARGVSARRERGVVMFVALVVLIVMTLAGLAMMRQMSSGVSIAGNIAFKQGATAVADAGIEAGRAWIGTNPLLLETHQPADGYYATWGTSVDPTSAAWDARWAVAPILPAATTGNSGNTVRYVIERLCSSVGPVTSGGTQQCSDFVPTSGGGESKSGGSYGGGGFTLSPAPYYRVTTQVQGPRNTVSYTQVVLN